MAVVKADAYGHGAVPVARALEEAGVDWFGVATVEEGPQTPSQGNSPAHSPAGGTLSE